VLGALCWVMVLFTVFGSRFLFVFCGACGVRKILSFLRMSRFSRNVLNMLYLWVSAHSSDSMPYANFFTFLFVSVL
jgi:hypothetical protein